MGLIGCATIENKIVCRQHEMLLKQIEDININDGVDRQEATILAQQYFVNYVSGCGAVGEPIDKGDYWEFYPVIGYAARKMDNQMHVDKKSGAISFKDYPTLSDSRNMLLDKQRELSNNLGCK
jgi:hypothetical protein